jgi:hypothetical protein
MKIRPKQLMSIQSNNHLLSLGMLIVVILGGCSATSSKGITTQQIIDKIARQQPVLIENVTFEEDLDFTKLAAFPETESVNKVFISSPVFFKGCTFKGKVMAFKQNGNRTSTTVCHFEKNLTFLDCKFQNEVNFKAASIVGIGCFSKSQFNRTASFEECDFGSEALFDHLLFANEAYFQNVNFRKKSNFWQSIWTGVCYFQGTTFGSDASFQLSDFRTGLDFSLCTCHGLLNFNFANFGKKGIFDNCRFKNHVEFNDANLRDGSFVEALFETKASFINLKSGSLSFKDAYFFTQPPQISLLEAKTDIINVSGARISTGEWLRLEKLMK